MKIKRKWDVSSNEVKKTCIEAIIGHYRETFDQEIGIIAAEEVLDIIAQHIGPDLYNKGVKDSKKKLQERIADLEVDLDLLENS